MTLLDFINSNPDWQKILSADPYRLKIKVVDEYILLSYSFIETDFSYDIAKEARGCIIRFDADLGKFVYVCRPFTKFFNYGEQYAADIDWNNDIYVREKIDGSLIKLWYDKGNWNLSTNGEVFAKHAPATDSVTFYKLFLDTVGGDDAYHKLTSSLDTNYTYCFELVTRLNKCVISYAENAIYYLSAFETQTGKEADLSAFESVMIENGIKMPQVYKISSLAGAIGMVLKLGKDKEGVVVSDIHSNRIKIKTPEYVALHRAKKNGDITKYDLFKSIVNTEYNLNLDIFNIDDFLGAFPEYNDIVTDVKNRIKKFNDECRAAWDDVSVMAKKLTRKEIAFYIQDKYLMYCTPLFIALDGKGINPILYLNGLSKKTLYNVLGV